MKNPLPANQVGRTCDPSDAGSSSSIRMVSTEVGNLLVAAFEIGSCRETRHCPITAGLNGDRRSCAASEGLV